MPLPLDTLLRVETPEAIDLMLRPASVIPRALAYAIDLAIRGAIMALAYLVLGFLGHVGVGLIALLTFLISWWYMVLFEVLNQGRSPGKQLMKLRVLNDDGTPVGWSGSLLRNLLRVVDLLPFGYAMGILSSLLHPSFKRLGDLVAGTLVVHQEQPHERFTLQDVIPLSPPFALGLIEQQAILSFAERQNGLSLSRRDELAALLAEPLGVDRSEATERLNRIAQALLGAHV
ncbi:RDD family protein [Pseudomonas luteola]|uniref:RDD family protein n=1 Tax=Pseudomonas luteola TaxID=47886 RepID=A0ABS0MMC3_PSELU|nr:MULTISPECIES: RDD family protein [Pseudomonas]MBA1247140.1 RDD family protein [Pseudomonas zeshuii]MBH3437874.1 RDD family protein [Pseudomonas luteola]QEU28237.1 RDD family protein [Pseudomonas luteola]RRW46602.1 RDD family protein [Pseudomonas luteola]